MCQCVLFDCWWCNFCGGKYGCAAQYCCLGYWCCAPENFPQEAKCCYCFEKIGWGSNLSCIGGVCCAQDWLMKWSKAQKWRNHLILDHFFYFLIHLIQNNHRQDFSCSFSGKKLLNNHYSNMKFSFWLLETLISIYFWQFRFL